MRTIKTHFKGAPFYNAFHGDVGGQVSRGDRGGLAELGTDSTERGKKTCALDINRPSHGRTWTHKAADMRVVIRFGFAMIA